jgi:VanZ family protein
VALFLWGPVAGVMALIFYLSSLSDPPIPSGVSPTVGHWLGYALLGVAVARALAGGLPRRITLRIAVGATLVCVGYGITDEFHQSFVPGRVADIADLYADAAGAMAAVAACWAWGILAARPGSESRATQ